MSAARAFFARLASMFDRPRRERELAEELEAHLAMHTDENIGRGMSPSEARRQAVIALGGLEQTKERVRERHGLPTLESIAQDVRFGARLLRKNPAGTIAAVATLALGIGANTALFSVVSGVLLKPLPYPQSERLVTLHESKQNFAAGSISFPNFRDWRDRNRSFTSIAVSRNLAFSLTGLGEAEKVRGRLISADFFQTLGVRPVAGRLLAPGEDEIGARPAVIVSESLWRRKLPAIENPIGRSLTLDGKDFPIVGVVPASFDLLLQSGDRREIFLPVGQWGNSLLTNRGAGLGFHGIGRLKPGVTLAQASSDMSRVARELETSYPDKNRGIGATLIPLREVIVGEVEPYLLVLLGAVVFVLLIACVNVANLLLARSTARSRELAIRGALGAGRARLIRQLLTEAVLLSLAGGGLGLALASRGTKAAVALFASSIPRAEAIGLDYRVLAFTIALSVLTGLVSGLAPALKLMSCGSAEALKDGGRGAVGDRRRTQAAFVVVEIATALVLLIGAGLMIRTLSGLWSVERGFDSNDAIKFSLSLPPAMNGASPAAIRTAIRALDERLGATPGVAAASMSWESFPMVSDDEQLFWMDGQPKPSNPNDMNWSVKYVVEPGYLRAMGLRLKRGRFFDARDDEKAPLALVVDERLARKYFGNGDPVGRRLNLDGFERAGEIIGVVGNVSQWGLASERASSLDAQLYFNVLQMPDDFLSGVGTDMDVVVRPDGARPTLPAEIRRTLKAMDPQQVVYGETTLDRIVAETLAARRSAMILSGSFALLALLLASIGIYGVISSVVGQRRSEISVRMALGADRRAILKLIAGEGARLAAAGIVAGAAGAGLLTRLMSRMLYGVGSLDPLTFGAMAALLGGIAMIACGIPAVAASRLDPVAVLRTE